MITAWQGLTKKRTMSGVEKHMTDTHNVATKRDGYSRRPSINRPEAHVRLSNTCSAYEASTELALEFWSAGLAERAADLYYQIALAGSGYNSDAYSSYLYCLQFSDFVSWERIVQEHEFWGEEIRRHQPEKPTLTMRTLGSKPIRVGLISSCFRNHIVGLMIRSLLPKLNRNIIELFGYHTHVSMDDFSVEISRCFEQWNNVSKESVEVLAATIARDQLDVLIDLDLHMHGSALRVLSLKPAPVNVTWLGYPGLSGVAGTIRFWDFELGASAVVGGEEKFDLEGGYWCYPVEHSQVEVSESPFHRCGFVTFGCFNNPAKISDRTLGLWQIILDLIPNARLAVLVPDNSRARRIFEDRVAASGIASSRWDAYSYADRDVYLSYYANVDIALDTVPYNGHTTTLDALWMGLPVVSLMGRTPAGRAGASILGRLGFKRWVAQDEGSYIRIARDLSADREALVTLRRAMRSKVKESSMGSPDRFARSFERAISSLVRDYSAV
jgi:protein O-GlcNAc transferase